MKKKFNCEIGYSDHSKGFSAANIAIANGATFIEKHVRLKNSKGIDLKIFS